VESDVTAESKRLRQENEILRQERDMLKKRPGGKSMRFALIVGSTPPRQSRRAQKLAIIMAVAAAAMGE